jgi:hypothetical protein
VQCLTSGLCLCWHCCFSLRSLYNRRSPDAWLVVSIAIVALLQWCDIRVGGCTRSTEAPGLNAYRWVTFKVHLHNFVARFERKSCCLIVVSVTNSCNYQYASFSTWSSRTCPHCSLRMCSVSQVVSVYAGSCCCSLCSLYISRSTERWLVESITIVVLLQWDDVRVGGYTRSTAAPVINAYRQVTFMVHLHNFVARFERKSCCLIVVAMSNSRNYQSASYMKQSHWSALLSA